MVAMGPSPTGPSFAEMASSGMSQLKHQMAIAGTKAGFVTYRTASGDSLGSLGSYSKNWNLADTEVTSKPTEPQTLVATPGTISRKFAVAKRVLQDASAEAQVNTLLILRLDRKSTRLNSSHSGESRMPSSA